MPRIPSILATSELRGDLNVHASPASVSSGFAIAGEELGRSVGQAVTATAVVADSIDRSRALRQQEVDARWVGDGLFGAVNELNEWQARPENNSREDYADQFSAQAGAVLERSSDGAPSASAARELRARLQARIAPMYQNALQIGERTRLDNNRESVVSQTADVLSSYRTALGHSPSDPVLEVVAAREDLRGVIDRMFGAQAPELAGRMRAYVDQEIALGVAREHPGYARSLVEASDSIPEDSKATLYNKIEALGKSQDMIRIDDFNRARADFVVASGQGKVSGTIPLSKYEEVFSHERAVVEKREDDEKISIANDVRGWFDNLAPTAPQAMERELAKMAGEVHDTRSAKVYRELSTRLREVRELQDKDRVSWLLSFNPEVMSAQDDVARATDAGTRNAALSRRNQAVKKYQGFPAAGDPNRDMYLGLSSNDRTLMTLGAATQYAAAINSGSPSEVMRRIDDVMIQFPDTEDRFIAFSDMVSLPGKTGIRQEYQVAYQNRDQWWVPSYLSALSSTEAVKQLDTTRESELDSEISRDPTWLKFQAAMIGPDMSRAAEIEGFRAGVQTMARSMHLQGRKISDAVKSSVKLLLDSTMGFATVHGRPIMISRENPVTGTSRNDEEVRDIGRRLEVSLRDLDPREVDQSRLPVLAQVHPEQMHINRLQALRDIITSTGFFVTDPDGQSMTLFVPGDQGFPVQVTDRERNVFRIYLSDLSPYTADERRTYTLGEQMYSTLEGKFPIQPEQTYPLQVRPPGISVVDRILGTYQKRTYWPTNAFRMEKR